MPGEQTHLNARLGLSPPCSTEPETAQVIALSAFHTLGPSTMEGTTRPMAPAEVGWCSESGTGHSRLSGNFSADVQNLVYRGLHVEG